MSETEKAETAAPRPDCLCMGLGPQLTQVLRMLGPSEDVRGHLRAARVEFLKAIRTMIDERIASLSREPSRGTKIGIE